MPQDIEILQNNIEARRAQMNLSKRAVSMAAGSEYVLRDIERGKMPSAAKLAAIAQKLETSSEALLSSTPSALKDRTSLFRHPSPEFQRAMMASLPIVRVRKAVPVDIFESSGVVTQLEGTPLALSETMGRVNAPSGLTSGRGNFAFYVNTTCMTPRFEPGDLVLVDSERPPRVGDDVLVLLNTQGRGGDGVLARLVENDGDGPVVEQFNPRRRIHLSSAVDLRRIATTADMLGAA